MKQLIKRLGAEWDMVLFDSPPIVAVTDSTMVSQEIDSMVMVVKAGETDREAFRRAVKSLQGANVPLAGVVVNGISLKHLTKLVRGNLLGPSKLKMEFIKLKSQTNI